MRYGPDQKEKTRTRILEAAARAFRLRGYHGIGVDGLAREAEITSGAFYGHFGSKSDVFTEIARLGLERLVKGVRRYQERHPEAWVEMLAEWYVCEAHRTNVEGGCGLPSLTPEIVRADPATKDIYRQALDQVVAAMTDHPPFEDGSAESRQRAWAVLALIAGGVMLARTMPDRRGPAEVAAGVRRTISLLVQDAGSGT
jgi:AcrR family transcriptional regulator